MMWACVIGIGHADAGSAPGSLRLDVDIVYALSGGGSIQYRTSFDHPISGTNWKNEIAEVIRARAISEWGDTIGPNDILYCDFTRG